ncbi:MAG: dual specificity protein phosphatase family protein [Campylobacterota bacterium]|nr:dual specificity protein phosphatase family protein [Campylobacterota bacterium]
MIKKLIGFFVIVVFSIGVYDYYNMNYNYNFGVITENKVYKSGAIKPSEIKSYTDKYNIKTVIDLRNEISKKYHQEEQKEAIDGIDGVEYINIPSRQVPDKKTLEKFFSVMDDKSKYPVLIHCYHGLGRTMLYVALYRIEYEGFSNHDARMLTRPYPVESFLHDSKFASTKSKGQFLINYVPRSAGEKATINTIK